MADKKSTTTMRAAVDRSIRAAIRADRIKKLDQSALIRASQKLADHMDLPGWPLLDGKLDTSTAPTLLRYLTALGVAPELDKKASASSRLDAIRGMASKATGASSDTPASSDKSGASA